MSTPDIPVIDLNDGNTIPQLGFGVYRVSNEDATPAVSAALEAGYRSIDTASYYHNEVGTGAAIASAAIPREQLFVTTKVWHTDMGYDSTLRAFDVSLGNLKLEYLDLYLIHWPVAPRNLFVETWRALEALKADGRVRSIGVSNFPVEPLGRLLAESSTVPVINQIELHPRLAQVELRAFNAIHGIATQAWSPLGQGKLVSEPTVLAIAERHNRTAAQILLRWNLEQGNLLNTRSVTPQRIKSNMEIFDFSLTSADHAELSAMNTGTRVGPDPEVYGIPQPSASA